MTATASAEYPSVAQFAAITKSGSNELHGAFYWGNFNNYFSARAWHDTQAARVHQSQHVHGEQWRTGCNSADLRRPRSDILLFQLQRRALPRGQPELCLGADA